MSTASIIALLIVGIIAGSLSGLVGVGGGVIIVPALAYFLGMTQHQAQGTTLFMFVLPIGILGVLNYYKGGNVDIKAALIISSTFVVGNYFGSKYALQLDQLTLKRIFGAILLLLSIKLMWGK